jgi:hypothetical protein
MIATAARQATRDIVVEEVLPHAPERVWKTLTTGGLHSGFRSPGNDFAFDAMSSGWGRVMQSISQVAAET